MKNAFAFLFHEWANKPIGLLSHGGVSGGIRAAQASKPVLTAQNMIPVHEAVIIPFAQRSIEAMTDASCPNSLMRAGADDMLDAVMSWIPADRVSPQRAADTRGRAHAAREPVPWHSPNVAPGPQQDTASW